jgi:hypothetical protein
MSLTDKVVLGSIGVLLAYEAWTLFNGISGDTISESVWRVAATRPLVPFLAGMLCGHFFWSKVC